MARNNLILESDFGGANPFKGFTLKNEQFVPVDAQHPDVPKNIAQALTPDGIKCLKYVLNKTDPIVSSSKRAEIQLSGTDAPQESERWYGLRYWLEKYDADTGRESILQWHDDDGTTPPLSIQVGSGEFTVMQSFTSGNIPTQAGPTSTGKWVSFVIHVKWSTQKTGILQVWRDGAVVVDKKNIQTNSQGGSYLKLGINKWSWAPGGGSSTSTQRIFYIDQFRMGNEFATFNDVAPDGLVIPTTTSTTTSTTTRTTSTSTTSTTTKPVQRTPVSTLSDLIKGTVKITFSDGSSVTY